LPSIFFVLNAPDGSHSHRRWPDNSSRLLEDKSTKSNSVSNSDFLVNIFTKPSGNARHTLQEGRAKRKARSTVNVVGNQWMGLKLNAQRATMLPLLSMCVIVMIWHFHLSMLVTFTLRKLFLPVHLLRKLLKRLLRVTMITGTLAAQVVQLPMHLTVMRWNCPDQQVRSLDHVDNVIAVTSGIWTTLKILYLQVQLNKLVFLAVL